MEFISDSTEQIYVRPARDSGPDLREIDLHAVFAPPMTGLGTDEPVLQWPKIEQLLGLGRPGEVLRNLLAEANRDQAAWEALQTTIGKLFGYRLLPPDTTAAHILAEYETTEQGVPLDIASAGSGFQQVLMLLAFLNTRRNAVMLLDEPDAHLHMILQDAIYHELRSAAARHGSQLIVATHSEVVINTVEPRELLVTLSQPRAVADSEERRRLISSLRVLSNADVTQALVVRGILYVEDYTDVNILRAWAQTLQHRASGLMMTEMMWKPIAFHAQPGRPGRGITAREHFAALQLVRANLPGLELLDGDAHRSVEATPITGNGLQRLRWRRYEIESYLLHPEALARFVAAQVGAGAAPQHVDDMRTWWQRELPPAVAEEPLGEHPFLNATKARTDLLPPLLEAAEIFGLPYTRYHEIAASMLPAEIHPEVGAKLGRNLPGVRSAAVNVHEVPEPILNSPFEEPGEHWRITEHEPPQRMPGRRPAMYFYRPPGHESSSEQQGVGTAIGLKLVNRIRGQLAEWRPLALRGEGGVTRTTMELLRYWRREGRKQRLFFAQLEAAETVIFLTEARPDLLQGIEVPLDEPSAEAQANGFRAFPRYACKMATGTGKTTVMGMLAAWSILNKVAARSDRRYSDTVLVVCPNVTIRNRLEELKPQGGEASLYRTRDLVPPHLMSSLARGSVLVMNWHVFEPKSAHADGQSARVLRAGQELRTRETIRIGARSATVRGSRYLTPDDLNRQVALGLLTILDERRDRHGTLKSVAVESVRYVESDGKLVERVLAREVGGKGNILLMNDEAHHAYRIRRQEPDDGEGGSVRRYRSERGVLPRSHGLDRRSGPHPQAARHQPVRRPVRHPLLPGTGSARTRTGRSPGWSATSDWWTPSNQGW